MKICVLVKEVPDAAVEKRINPSTGRMDRSGEKNLNPFDTHAIEAAMQLKEGGDLQVDEVVAVTMGPDSALRALHKAVSLGADRSVHLADDALAGSDALQTSYALSKALETLEYDLVIAGSEATDSRMAIMTALLAERTGRPQLSGARKVTVDGGTVRIERQTENGYDVVEAATPALVSVVEKINEPRYPSFKGIMAAKKKPLTTLTIADAGIDAGQVGIASAPSQVAEFATKPPRQAGQVVKDEGDGGVKIAEYLASQKLV